MPLNNHPPISATPIMASVPEDRRPLGNSRLSFSCPRRSRSSKSGGELPPAGPLLQGPREPWLFPLSGWPFQDISKSGDCEFCRRFRLVSESVAVICASLPRRNEAELG